MNNLKTDRSKGCNLCVQWGGNDNNIISFVLQKLSTSMFKCDSSLFKS